MASANRCMTCKFFAENKQQPERGECRFNPPSMVPTPQGPGSVFPIVRMEHWCGKHETGIQLAS